MAQSGYNNVLDRAIPHSIEAEQAVLGAMIIDSRCVPEVIGTLKSADFFIDTNREIFECIYSMFNFSVPIDPVTLLAQMQSDGVRNENSQAYVMDLMNITPTAVNVLEYAQIVRDKALLRAIADAGGEIANMAVDGAGGAGAVLEAAEKRIYALRQGKNAAGLEPISEIIIGVYEKISEAAKNGTELPGLPTGLEALDRSIMGLNNSDLIIIASRPGMGKTSIALNMALNAAKKTGKSVAIFSLEMSREQLAIRLLSSESFIDNKKLQTGRLSPDDWEKLAAAAASISGCKLLINDNPSLSVADMNAQCRRVDNLGLVVIDYLQLMQSASGGSGYSGENRTQVVSDISRMMKIMAKELNVPVICLSQLSRINEPRNDKRPTLSALRESGSIEQDADIVLGLYRSDYYRDNEQQGSEGNDVSAGMNSEAECIILKNRRGETGIIKLMWLPQYTTYTSIEERYEGE